MWLLTNLSYWGVVNPVINGQIAIDIAAAAASQVKPHVLGQPAFSPALSRIILQAGPGRWSIPIENHSESGITVQDILAGIYSLYYTAIDSSQAVGIPETAMSSARVWADRRGQANSSNNNKLYRLDFLCGQTRLRGVAVSQDRTSCLVYMC